MKPSLAVAAILFMPACGYAQATPAEQAAPAASTPAVAKPCEDLKSEIAAKLDAKGVKSYTLEIVAKDQNAEGKQVGTCEGGTKKIMYRRGAATPAAAAPQAAAKEPSKP